MVIENPYTYRSDKSRNEPFPHLLAIANLKNFRYFIYISLVLLALTLIVIHNNTFQSQGSVDRLNLRKSVTREISVSTSLGNSLMYFNRLVYRNS